MFNLSQVKQGEAFLESKWKAGKQDGGRSTSSRVKKKRQRIECGNVLYEDKLRSGKEYLKVCGLNSPVD